MHAKHRRGFTLIELLVVTAIVALLVAILLPAIASARRTAWLAMSLSNIRQITAGATVYREDYKGYWPLYPNFGNAAGTPRRYDPSRKYTAPELSGWCTWHFGGKNCDPYWTIAYGGDFDVEAADRAANEYIYPDILIDAPPRPQALPATDTRRKSLEMFVFRDPSDQFSYQRDTNWNDLDAVAAPVSCYDDVGTSYQFNVKWWDQLDSLGVLNRIGWFRSFNFGCDRLRVGDAFETCRMVWINDQFADVVVNNNDARFRLRNGYNDYNKSVMGFVDGHAAYHPVYPGINNPRSYKNEFYTFVFEDLHPPAR